MRWAKSKKKMENEGRLGQWTNIYPQLKNPGDATAYLTLT